MYTKLERIKDDIEALAEFNATPGKGLTRFTYSKEHKQARDYIIKQMEAAGLSVREDAVGTIIGRLEGQESDAPVVMIGSHFDSVRNGGNFDGPAGVVTALETARVIKDLGLRPQYPIEFVALVEEEGSRFGGGLFASRAMAGRLTKEELETFEDENHITPAQAMKEFGLDPDKFKEAIRKPEELKAFLELHIEQGPILESTGIQVGIVDTIVGIKELKVSIIGRPDHAGTTPLNMRADAYLSACQVALAANEAAKKAAGGTVATVGKVEVLPGSFNIVPGEVNFFIDIRSKKVECITFVVTEIEKKLADIQAENPDLKYNIQTMMEVAPVDLDAGIRQMLEESAKESDISYTVMLSGAGHDAMVMADITKVGLIFVPSKGGRSHCPEEWTDYDLLQNGVEVAVKTILKIANAEEYK